MPSKTARNHATPGVEAGQTALRIATGRHTVDIVQTDGRLLAIAGDGVGREPATAVIGPAAVAVLLELADAVDTRCAWDTAAWPLCVDGTTAAEVEG